MELKIESTTERLYPNCLRINIKSRNVPVWHISLLYMCVCCVCVHVVCVCVSVSVCVRMSSCMLCSCYDCCSEQDCRMMYILKEIQAKIKCTLLP